MIPDTTLTELPISAVSFQITETTFTMTTTAETFKKKEEETVLPSWAGGKR